MDDGFDELDRLPDEIRCRIAEACDRFDHALRHEERARAEDFLFDAGAGADVLLRELLVLECGHRRGGGAPPTEEELAARFPGRRAVVAAALGLDRRYAAESDPTGLTYTDGVPTLVGGYRLLRKLGQGGFGVVFLAVDPLIGRRVAVKVPHPQILVSPALRALFAREARAATKLDHPNIVRFLAADESGVVCSLVSEYVPGPSLAEWLRDHAGPGRPAPAAAAELVLVLAGAVQHAHDRGVFHRDLKPANVILVGGDLARPKLTDFGLARLADAPDLTITGQVLGTPEYMAPEQAAGQRQAVGPRTDVYALGAVLYELLTGRPPVTGTEPLDVLRRVPTEDPRRPRSAAPEVPAELEAVCLRCLEKAPGRRYPSAGELAADLGRFLAGERTRARPRGACQRSWRWARRHPRMVTSGIIVVGAVLGLLGHTRRLATVNDQLVEVNGQLERALAEREASNRALSRTAYAADVRRAAALLDRGEVAAAQQALARWEPREGAEDLRGWEWYHLRHRIGRHEVARWEAGTVYSLAFSPDGRVLAGGGADGRAHLWDGATGRDLVPPLPHPADVNQLAWAPDGAHLATACDDGAVRVWPRTGGPARELGRHAGRVEAVAYAPDGRTLASSGLDRHVYLWDPVGTAPPQVCAGDIDGARALAFTPGGQFLVVARGPNLAQLLAARPQGAPGALFDEYQGPVAVVRTSVAGNLVVTAGRLEVRVSDWDAAAGAARLRFRLPNWEYRVNDVAVAPDGRSLAVAGDGAVELWDLAGVDSPRLRLRLCGHEGRVWAAAFHPAGRRLATAGADGTVRVWDLAEAREATEPLVAPRAANRVALLTGRTPPRVAVLPVARDTVEVWDWRGGGPVAVGHASGLQCLAAAPDGRWLVTQDTRGWVTRWAEGGDAPAGTPRALVETPLLRPTARAPVESGLNFSLAVSPDGRRVAAAVERRVHLLDAGGGEVCPPLSGHRSAVLMAAFRPDGGAVAGGSGGQVCLWDVPTGAPAGVIDGVRGGLRALAYAPDGRALAGGGDDHTIRVWGATGTQLRHLVGHRGPVRALAYAPDGRTLASGSTDGTLRLWQADSGDELLTVEAPRSRVSAVAFGAGGRELVFATQDGWDGERLVVYRLDCGRPLAKRAGGP